MTVVENLRKLNGNKLVTEGTNVPVESQTLEVNVGSTQNGSTRGLVASTRLDTNESVLDNIDTADTVLTGESVEGEEDLDAVSVNFLLVRDGDLDRETSLELDGDLLRGSGSVFGGDSEFPHVGRGSGVGVFEDTSFVGDVVQVLVGRPGLGGGLGDGDVLLSSVGEECLPSGEAVVEF